MPRIKQRAEPAKQAAPEQPLNGTASVLGDVLTLTEAATYLRISESEVIGQVQAQGLPGRLIAGQWRFSKAAIQQWLATGAPTPQTRKAAQLAAAGAFKDDPDLVLSTPPPKGNKEAWMALAGIWKDDPHAEEELKEIHRRRGRSTTEDEK